MAPILFSKHVLPLLSPYASHHAELRDYRSLMQSGWVIPGKGEESELIRKLEGRGDGPRMPLDGPYFKHDDIERIEEWINQGAENDKEGEEQPEPSILFSKHVLPLLSPYASHHAELRDYRSLMQSGWVIPGKGEESELIRKLEGRGDGPRMPLDGPYFKHDDIERIEEWINQGAKNDAETPPIRVIGEASENTVLIMGAGVAGLTAGIELIERGFDVTILTEGHRLGGKGSSWRDSRVDPKATWHDDPRIGRENHETPKSSGPVKYRGPAIVNHGYHSVFGFYHNFIDLLKRVGAYKNLIPNDHSFQIMENGKVHRLEFMDLPFPFHAIKGLFYSGLSCREKMRFALWAILVFAQDPSKIEKYDYHAFATWSRGRGLGDASLKTSIIRMLQEGDFNTPYGFSAYIALNGIIEMFKDYPSTLMYHFNGGITQTLMNPLGAYFQKKGGRIVYRKKVVELRHDRKKITGVVVAGPHCHYGGPWEDGTVGVEPEEGEYRAGHYISTLPVANFLELNRGDHELWDQPYFRNMWSFDTVDTFAYQIWLSKKITPPELSRNVIVGLRPPFCTVMDYKEIIDEYKSEPQLGSVIDMIGSQSFFRRSRKNGIEYGWTREELRELALQELARCEAFKECRDPRDPGKFNKDLILHEEFHENNASHNRFFLTLPKSTRYRPGTRSPYSNLLLAGDWIKNNTMDFITMEGACISGKLAANEILSLGKGGKIEIKSRKDGALLKLLRLLARPFL